jgi:hypothetical protein
VPSKSKMTAFTIIAFLSKLFLIRSDTVSLE